MGSGTYYILNEAIRISSQISLFENEVSKDKLQSSTLQDNIVTNKMTPQDNEAPNKKVQQDKVEDSILEFCISSKRKKEIADYLNLKDIRHLTESYLKILIKKENLNDYTR